MMLTLYYSPGACSLAVHIILEWLGTPVQLIKADKSDPVFLKHNPAQAVPTLVFEDGYALTQCSAILKYLVARNPSLECAAVDHHLEESNRWDAFLSGDLHPAFFPFFSPNRYTISTEPSHLDEVKKAAILLIKNKLAILDQHLVGKNYFVNNTLSYIDAYAVPMFRWALRALENGLDDFENVKRHYDNMLTNDGVERAMKAEGIWL